MLKHITLTGVDEKTDLSKLWKLSKLYPLVEFGILYSESNSDPRYPGGLFVSEFIHFAHRFGIKASIHFCGSSVDKVLKEELRTPGLPFCFQRVQLNFNHAKSPIDLGLFNRFIENCELLCKTKSPNEIITQHNNDNKVITDRINKKSHVVLIDSSLGTGKLIESFDYVTTKESCGFAGGLSLENLPVLLPRMFSAADGKPFWIDMESSLRTNKQFDIQKAEETLKVVYEILSGL